MSGDVRADNLETRNGRQNRVPPADIEFIHVSKLFPGQSRPAIDDLSFKVSAGEICCLVGHSGGGKTTAMKLVNRLIELTEGDITIGGQSVRSVDPTILRRGIGYVIQEVGLFPHMTIGANIAVLPRLLRWPAARTRQRIQELLELVRLGPEMADRYPAQLSGGQQQRVGLARALAVDPPVMLMDEPFGALDPITRARLQTEFLRLQQEIQKTVIFVTHDIDEAIRMGDRVLVLAEGGTLAQYASPEELLAHPADGYVASLLGEDRGLKRLSLLRLGDVVAAHAPAAGVDARLPRCGSDTSLRVALAMAIDAAMPAVAVCDGDDVIGTVNIEQLHQALVRQSAEVAAADS
ncbi:MAG: ATP-binding cassette domain-containing protein [Candidatus Dormibacteraeota bacterium]|nr:ATP-binding cassette domain-containing protein [Candidatus Dormibacteraeota bacterium]MDQ6899573.1 ATP-binding cassette domain-containing protein [Candidatus Dormibacteraeota bacterium]